MLTHIIFAFFKMNADGSLELGEVTGESGTKSQEGPRQCSLCFIHLLICSQLKLFIWVPIFDRKPFRNYHVKKFRDQNAMQNYLFKLLSGCELIRT